MDSAFVTKRILVSAVYRWVWSAIRLVLLVGIGFIIIYPLLVKLASSFMEARDLWDRTVKWIPKNFTLTNYTIAFKYMDYPSAFLNSFCLAALVSVLQLMSCTMVGYSLARFRYALNGLIFGLVVFTLIVPPQMILIPLYMNFRFFNLFGLLPGDGLNLIGSLWPPLLMACSATGLKNGLFIYIMRQFFRGMPRQLEEAAYIDGAGALRTFFTVLLPNAIPAMVTVFLFSFVWQWNDIFYASIFMQGRDLLPFSLQGVATQYDYAYLEMHSEFLTGQELALIENTASLLFIAPVVTLYVFLQRYFVESVERTGLVG